MFAQRLGVAWVGDFTESWPSAGKTGFSMKVAQTLLKPVRSPRLARTAALNLTRC